MNDGNPEGYNTVGDPGNTYWYRIACPSGYSFSSNYTVGQDCNDGGGSGSCTGFYRNAGTAWKQNYSPRSEERRVGKEWVVRVDLGGRRIIKKKKHIVFSVDIVRCEKQ